MQAKKSGIVSCITAPCGILAQNELTLQPIGLTPVISFDMYIEQLYTNCLAEAAYYIESDGESAIIDPLRETEPYLAMASRRNSRIKYVFETHFHADFVSGHIDLSRMSGAPIVYGPMAKPAYDVLTANDGQEFAVGKLTIRVLHTPGHTPESTCYLLLDEKQQPHAIFTGDTLFVGDVGRPDLLDGVMTSEELASMMYDSLNQKIKTLPDHVIVYPGHGPGSACGKNIGKETFSTIGEQKKFNYALKAQSRAEFVRQVTDGITPPPAYFFEDARINKQGYAPVEEVVHRNTKPLSAAAVDAALESGAVLLDTRDANEFEKGFVPGSINIGLNGQYAVWVGTLLDIHKPIVLVTTVGKEQESVLRLARVGYENVIGYLEGGAAGWKGPLDKVHSIEASEVPGWLKKGTAVIDVRKPGEWSISHFKGAQFIPLAEMPLNLAQLDKSKSYVVHCAGGYRSMIAISMMKQQGFTHLINVYGGSASMINAGLDFVPGDETAVTR